MTEPTRCKVEERAWLVVGGQCAVAEEAAALAEEAPCDALALQDGKATPWEKVAQWPIRGVYLSFKWTPLIVALSSCHSGQEYPLDLSLRAPPCIQEPNDALASGLPTRLPSRYAV
jgi:hypothetical protein